MMIVNKMFKKSFCKMFKKSYMDILLWFKLLMKLRV